MFGFGRDRLLHHECKDYLLTNSIRLKPEITLDSKTRFEVTLRKKDRKVIIALITINGGQVEVDVSDSYYMLRIERKKFTNKDKCFTYILNTIREVDKALQKT